jgi:amino acid transporter
MPTLAALVVANMIGAGVFTSSGYSLGDLGNPGRVMLAWWLCGAWAICGAVAYGALVSRLPMSGGEYLFLSRFVHPSVGFLAGWISVIAGFTAPIALAAQGAAVYMLPSAAVVAESSDGVTSEESKAAEETAAATRNRTLTLIASCVIVSAALCHLAGIALGVGVQNSIVAAKLVLLAVVIVWAFAFAPTDAWQGGALPDRVTEWWPEDFSAWIVLAGSMSWVALSYTGFNAAVYVASEAKDARRSVPRAMLWATIAVTVIYLLLNYVFVYAPAPESIVFQENVAAIASRAVGGVQLEWLVRFTIVLAMTSSVFAMLLAGPRVYSKMAEDGVMPAFFRAEGSPKLAIAVQAALSLIAVFVTDLLQLMKYLGLTLSACGALAVLSLWWVRKKLPDAHPLRWWETTAMIVYLGITACILAASWNTHPDEFNAMFATFVVGVFIYSAWVAVDAKKTHRVV